MHQVWHLLRVLQGWLQGCRAAGSLAYADSMQDAQEFLNYLLNQAAELLEEEVKQQAKASGLPPPQQPVHTFVHDIFQASAHAGCFL